jgi:hypothetical protein
MPNRVAVELLALFQELDGNFASRCLINQRDKAQNFSKMGHMLIKGADRIRLRVTLATGQVVYPARMSDHGEAQRK